MECPKCSNQLKDTAKFCGKCGTKIEATIQKAEENSCVSCDNPLKPNAKFCGKCGAKQPVAEEAVNKPTASDDNPNKGYIVWEMQPGQVAMKLSEKIFSQYDNAKGVIIPEGYLAMVLVGGKMQAMLEAGVYQFERKTIIRRSENIVERITGFFSNLFSSRKNKPEEQTKKNIEAVSQAAKSRLPVEIIVCRSSDFPLPFTFKNVPTSAIKIDVGILITLQVSNLLAMFKKHLLDKTVLAAETLANELSPFLEEALHQHTRIIKPENIALNSELKNSLSGSFKALFAERFPFFEFLGIIKMETKREELQRLEQLAEEMYLSEQELDQLTRRNEFMNRLNQQQNSAELQNATNDAEFNQRLAEINRDNLLTQEEMATLQRSIQERAEDHELSRARQTEMIIMQHQYDVQAARVKMEEDLGGKLFNIQLDRQRTTDDYKDERRRKEHEIEKDEMLSQMELLRQAQAVREERERAEHDRRMDEKRSDQSYEVEKLNVFAGMTAEQIMVANPHITAEAAKAMAEKFKAEAATATTDARAADAQEQTRMMKEFMEQQMAAVRDMSAANAQAIGGTLAAKEREIERTQQMTDKNEERYAGVVREQMRSQSKTSPKRCKDCGPQPADEAFCPDCGKRLEEA